MGVIEPRTGILPPAQRAVWPYLNAVPEPFVLYGGTAIALRYGHRDSDDLDFFTSEDFASLDLLNLPFVREFFHDAHYDSELRKIDIFLRMPQVSLESGYDIAKLSFVSRMEATPGCIRHPDVCRDNGVKVASPVDLMATKILAADQRAKTKDFIDIVELIKQGVSLHDGFRGCLDLASVSGISYAINLSNLLNDFRSGSPANFLGDPQDVKILNEAAKNVDLDRIFRSRGAVHRDMHSPAGDVAAAGEPKKKPVKAQSLNEFIAEILWYDDPDVFKYKNHLLVFVLSGPLNWYYRLVENFDFTRDDFAEAMENAPPGYFWRNAGTGWLRWNRFFGIDPPFPFPVRGRLPGPKLIPIDRKKFPVLPGDVLRRAPTREGSRRART